MSIDLAAGMKRFIAPWALLAGMCSSVADAQPLEDVTLEFQEQGVVATIRLSGPVQYVSHFPQSHGRTLEIFYNRVPGTTEKWVDNEVRNSPSSQLIPNFTVTTRDQQTKPRLVIEFSREAEYSVAAGKDNRSLLITIRPDRQPVSEGPLPLLPTIRPEVTPVAGAALTEVEAAAAETNKEARALMVQGREALAARNNEAGVDALNKLLLLPPNDYTQDAQEWVGVARERAGQKDKAKVEYDLYLRLFPESEGAARVAQRLAGLSGLGDSKLIAATSVEKKQAASLMTFGSVTSRYYYGRSKIDSTFDFNGATTTDTQSLTDQSMLITSVDVSERYRSEEYDGRLVFRDTNTRNFLVDQPSLNRVSAAYGEIKNRTQNYLLRLGRQSPTGGGVQGRFDGLAGYYGEAADLRVNGVAGVLSDYSQGSKPKFYGASVDSGAFSVYGINQTVDGTLDRRAVGTEFRYFEDKNTVYALLDYDTYFKAVNTAQFMGTTGVSNATLNLMVDHRKTPSLSIRNALNGASTSSINALLQTMSASSLRELALERTAISNMGQIGATLPLGEKWQAGGDFRLTNTTGLPASGTDPATNGGIITPEGYLAATPARGLEKSVTGQIIGSNIRSEGDIWSGSVTFSTSSAVNGNAFYVYNHTQFNSGWMMDATLQLSSYKDQFGGKTTRKSPMLRGAYRVGEQFYFDVDGGIELINYSGTQSSTKTTRYFYSAGLRWDF